MKKYALLVGVEDYKDKMISQLQFAGADATALADRLTNRCGFEQVRVLADGSSENKPSLVNIVTALGDISVDLQSEDLFLFFFAGHGVEKDGRGYLMVRESLQAFPEHGSLSLKLLRKTFERLAASKRIVLLDACRNSPQMGRSDASNFMGDAISRDIVAAARTNTSSSTTTILLSACRTGQRAYEWPTKGHGVFSYYLLDGLDGAAWKGDRLDFSTLASYVTHKVREWSSRMPNLPVKQEPWFEHFGEPESIELSGAIEKFSGLATETDATQEVQPHIVKKTVEDEILCVPEQISKSHSLGVKSVTLEGHTGAITSVAFGSDGQLLASGSNDSTIKLWDIGGQVEITTLKGHMAWIKSIAFSPDGKLLASGGLDRNIILWNVKTRREIRTWEGHKDSVKAVAFSPDGKLLASGCLDGTITIWDVESQRKVRTIKGGQNTVTVNSIAFSPDGEFLAGSYAGTGKVILWKVKSKRELNPLTTDSQAVHSNFGLFSPNGRLLASGGKSGNIVMWDTRAQRKRATLCENSHVYSVAFSPDEQILATGGDDKMVVLWNLATKNKMTALEGHTSRIKSVAFSPDGKVLASGSDDKTIRLWDIEKLELTC